MATEAQQRDKQSDFRPDIEGLRAVAILLVILYHAHVPGVAGGYIGVDVFFALSGYLITGILAREFQTKGRIDFWRFYARRVRRLLPAASLVVLVVLLLGRTLYAPGELWPLATQSAATSLYLSNIPFILSATDYLALGQEHSPLLHTWSLAVEEQFYLIWPAAVALALRLAAGRRWLGLWPLGVLTVASLVLSTVWTRTEPIWAFFAMPARVWEFAFGAFAALLPLTALEARFSGAIGWLALGGICVGASVFASTTPFPGSAALVPVLGVALLVRATATAPSAGVGQLLGLASMQTLGRLSYSWYLWHWPLLVFARHRGWVGGAWSGLAVCGLALALAQLTFVLVESPVRQARTLVARPAVAVLAGILLSAGVAGVALGVRQLCVNTLESAPFAPLHRATEPTHLQTRGCQLGYAETANRTACDFGPADAAQTIVLFGDSHAAQWFAGLEVVAAQAGWRLRVRVKSECPSVDTAVFSTKLRREYTECATWRRLTIAELTQQPGQLIVLANSRGYLAPDGVTLADWQAGLAHTARQVAQAGQHVVILRDSPRPGLDVPNCLASRTWPWLPATQPCDVPRATALSDAVWHAETAAVAGLAHVRVLDLTPHICPGDPCPAMAGATLIYADSNHLTADFAAGLAPELRAGLTAALAAP